MEVGGWIESGPSVVAVETAGRCPVGKKKLTGPTVLLCSVAETVFLVIGPVTKKKVAQHAPSPEMSK